MLCAASQSAVGAMALMDLDSRQILQLEGNLLFITEPLAEQLNGFPGMADKPVKAGETATEAFVARLAAISDEQWKAFLSKTAADDEQEQDDADAPGGVRQGADQEEARAADGEPQHEAEDLDGKASLRDRWA